MVDLFLLPLPFPPLFYIRPTAIPIYGHPYLFFFSSFSLYTSLFATLQLFKQKLVDEIEYFVGYNFFAVFNAMGLSTQVAVE
jgi:hypothetical protein